MTKLDGMRPCLFCKQPGGERTLEHVLQRGFGAEMKLTDDVCAHCNTVVFSPLDSKLIDHVRTHAYWDHPDVKRTRNMLQGDPSYMLYEGVWQSVRLSSDMKPIPMAQLIFLPDNQLWFVAEKESDRDTVTRELGDPASLTITECVVQMRDDQPPMQSALVRSAPRNYVVRASTAAKAAKLRAATLSGKIGALELGGTAERSRVEQPNVYQNMTIDLGAIERALVKTALNFVCKVIGPDVARLGAFDDARRFAVEPVTKGAGRFFVRADALPFRILPSHHTLVVGEEHGCPFVMIALYGRAFGVVHLTEQSSSTSVLAPDTLIAALFDYVNKTHEVVSEGTRRFAELFPSDAELQGSGETA